MEISQLRREYSNLTLRRKDLLVNPFDQFKKWFSEALERQIIEPNAMQLATTDGVKPSLRTVLLKGAEYGLFTFYTNMQSRKASDLKKDPRASLLFYWRELERQVIIEGIVEKTPHEEADRYFSSRPRTSQLAAWASHQDQQISSRELLENQFKHQEESYLGKKIPKPPHWGGFSLRPERYEFWQGRPFRLHDRFQYILDGNIWKIDRLQP